MADAGEVVVLSILGLVAYLMITSKPELQKSASEVTSPSVNISLGTIHGQFRIHDNVKVTEFLGIPFAHPPVGDLRFRRPKPITKKFVSGQLNATKYSAYCPQLEVPGLEPQEPFMSEDCLTLNVWTPAVAIRSKNLRPVIAWVHGGGLFVGSSSQKTYDSLALASKGDLIVVTFNYRLGVFGFLTSGDDGATDDNAGLHDQLLALEWIQNNIRYFGGDPDRVTLIGESAGALSVGHHILSPLSGKRFFSKAIMMSGSSLTSSLIYAKQSKIEISSRFSTIVGCDEKSKKESDVQKFDKLTKKTIDCLRSKSVQDLLKEQFSPKLIVPSRILGHEFVSNHGDKFLPLSQSKALRTKKFESGLKVLVGIMEHEGAIFEDVMVRSPVIRALHEKEDFKSWKADLNKILKNEIKGIKQEEIDEILEMYFDGELDRFSWRRALSDVFGDYLLACPALLFGEHIANENQVHGYFFNYKTQSPGSYRGWGSHCHSQNQGACHASELNFLFGQPFLHPELFNDQDRKVSDKFMQLFIKFIKDETIAAPQFKSGVASILEIDGGDDETLINSYNLVCNRLWKRLIVDEHL